MKKLVSSVVAAGVVLALAAGVGFAQGPGGPGGPGGGQFRQMRAKYKFTFQLMNMVRHIGEIDKNPKYSLTPVQAKKTLAVLQPLRSKPKLTQDQAKDTLKKLKPIFTVAQLNAMAKIKPPQFGQRRTGQGGTGGPGGPGGPGRPGGMRRMDPNAMKDFNPFYTGAAKGDQFGARRTQRWNIFFANLQKRAKGSKAPLAPPMRRPGAPRPK